MIKMDGFYKIRVMGVHKHKGFLFIFEKTRKNDQKWQNLTKNDENWRNLAKKWQKNENY